MSEQTPQTNHIPVLPGFIEERTKGVAGPPAMLLRVWCRWCLRWHEHGYTGTAVGDTTHRAPHCFAPDSEYDIPGYNILVSGTPFSAVAGTMRKATPAQQRAIREGRINARVQQLRDQPAPAA